MFKRIAACLVLVALVRMTASAADAKPDVAGPGRQYVVGVAGMH